MAGHLTGSSETPLHAYGAEEATVVVPVEVEVAEVTERVDELIVQLLHITGQTSRRIGATAQCGAKRLAQIGLSGKPPHSCIAVTVAAEVTVLPGAADVAAAETVV